MAQLDFEGVQNLRKQARIGEHVHRAHVMLYASGLASLIIVAVAATIMTLF